MHVDAAVAGLITALPWGRFETLLTAKIIEADPQAAEERAKIWEAERFVRAGRTGQSGLKLLIAKANAGDVIWFMATLNRIAEILRLQGDLESADVRRSKAIGILAQPARALQLLWEFRNEQHPAAEPQQPGEPIENEPNPPSEASPPAEERPESTADLSEAEPPAESPGPVLIIRPSGVDQRKLRPQVMLHIHLSHEALLAATADATALGGGVGRLEGVGPVTLGHVRRFLVDTDVRVRVQPRSIHRTLRLWTAMRYRGESVKPCSSACRPAASPMPPAAAAWTSSTPSPTSRPPAADHPARPAYTTSARWTASNIASKRIADGRYDNPNQASGLAITTPRLLPGQQCRNPIPRRRTIRATNLAGGSAS